MIASKDPVYYLAGPMSGIPQFNFPAFFEATERLRAQGYMIVCPAELDNQEDKGAAMASPDGDPNNRDHMGGKTWGDFLARDVKLIADGVSGIIFLRGWYRSRGARLEAFVGLQQKGFTFATYWDGKAELLSPQSVMDQIYDVISGFDE